MAHIFSKTQLPFSLYSAHPVNFVVIAHRGASAYFPENTMSAFEAAVKMGADMIELDITLSKDGVPVVIHDEKLNRTTNGKGVVSDFTLEELKKLDAGSWYDSTFSDEKILTLEEVLKFAQNKISLNIEIKPEAVSIKVKDGIEQKSLELVKQHEMQNHVLFSSFNYQAISNLRALDEHIPTALLYEKRQASGKISSKQVSECRANAFNCNYRKVNKKWMDDLSEHNIPVFVYTVNREREMQKQIEMGVSGIFTDKPDVLKQIVSEMLEIK